MKKAMRAKSQRYTKNDKSLHTVAVRENVACICPVAWAPGGVALCSLCLSTAVCIEMHQKKFHLDWMTQS